MSSSVRALLKSRTFRLVLAIVLLENLAVLWASRHPITIIEYHQHQPVDGAFTDANSARYTFNMSLTSQRPHPTLSSDENITLLASFYSRRHSKVNSFVYDFLINEPDLCLHNDTDVVIFVHTYHSYVNRRSVIRDTWGSVARGKGALPLANRNVTVKLLFTFGVSSEESHNKQVRQESEAHHDVIMGNFTEDYRNLTLKSLLELKWMSRYCPHAQFLLKADDDMFVNLPALVKLIYSKNMTRAITGPYFYSASVQRKGKWKLTHGEFPFSSLPPYCPGSTYVISNAIVRELYETSEYVPHIFIDDVYITGILAKIIRAKHVTASGFAMYPFPRPMPCDIIKGRILTAHGILPSHMAEYWRILHANISCPESSSGMDNEE